VGLPVAVFLMAMAGYLAAAAEQAAAEHLLVMCQPEAAEQCESFGVQEEPFLPLTLETFK
jgi:hypothetical protein